MDEERKRPEEGGEKRVGNGPGRGSEDRTRNLNLSRRERRRMRRLDREKMMHEKRRKAAG
jgi:hypothetical protein